MWWLRLRLWLIYAPLLASYSKKGMRPTVNVRRITEAGTAFWHWLRGFAGDTAYEGYLRHAGACPGPRLTAEQFYLENMKRKYTRPNRCC